MNKIAIRADGEREIGLGHIQRCLALSSQLQREGVEVLFITRRNDIVKEQVEQEGFGVAELKDNLNLEEDSEHTIEIIKTNKVDVLVTDSYEFDEKYLTEVKKKVRLLVSIDDLAEIVFPSDIVMNQNIYAKDLKYRSSTGKTKFILGPQYALLRKEFSNLGKRKISEKVQNILITLGGSDPFNLTPKILNVLDKIEGDFSITVVIGHFFNNIPEIEDMIKNINKKVKIVYNLTRMASLMLSSDLAITGGGTTLYELAATGTPGLAFCLADNQIKNIKGMAEACTIIEMGWGNKLEEGKFYKEINKLIDNYLLRKKMSKLGQELVDRKGSWRVCKVILENSQKEYWRKK